MAEAQEISLEEAKQLILAEFSDLVAYLHTQADEVAFFDESTIEKPYGWVLFFNSRKYQETKNFLHRVQGVGVVIVNKFDRTVHHFFSHRPIDEQLLEYENRLNPKPTPLNRFGSWLRRIFL